MARQPLPDRNAPAATLRASSWRQCALPLLLLTLLSLPALLPLLHPGLPASHDAPFAVYRVYELDRGLRSGIFYPRWAPDFAFGYGYPSLNFYAPLSFYLAELYHLLGASLVGAIKLSFATAALGGAVGMYAWVAGVWGRRAAIVSAVAYLYVPFHLLTMYSRVDELAEFGATAFFPALLWAVNRLSSSGRRRYLVALALLYGGLICTYNIFALYFTPVLLGYILVCLVSRTGGPLVKAVSLPVVALQVVTALALGLAASCFFWLPALAERRYIQAGGLTQGLLDFHRNYLSLGTLVAPSWLFRYDFPAPWRDPLPYHLDRFAALALIVLPLMLLAQQLTSLLSAREGGHSGVDPSSNLTESGRSVTLGVGAGFSRPEGGVGENPPQASPPRTGYSAGNNKKPRRDLSWPQLGFLAVLLAGTIWLMLPGSAGALAAIPLAAYIQFPWRLLDIAGLVSSAAYGVLLLAMESLGVQYFPAQSAESQQRGRRVIWAWLLPAALILFASVPSLPRLQPDFLPLPDSQVSPGAINAYEQYTGNIGTSVAGEFLPRWVSEKPTSSAQLVGNPPAVSPLDPATLPPGSALVGSNQRPLAATVHVQLTRPAVLRFLTLYFPGWQAQVDGQPAPIAPNVPQGLIEVTVPAGRHRVTIAFSNTPVRLLASTISWLALGILLLVAAWRKKV